MKPMMPLPLSSRTVTPNGAVSAGTTTSVNPSSSKSATATPSGRAFAGKTRAAPKVPLPQPRQDAHVAAGGRDARGDEVGDAVAVEVAGRDLRGDVVPSPTGWIVATAWTPARAPAGHASASTAAAIAATPRP